MSGTIFDLIEEESPSIPKEGKEGFFDLAQSAPQPKDNSFFNSVADYGKTILKGATEGLGRLGQIMGPLREGPRISEGKIELGRSPEQQLEEQTENLDELLPTDEGFTQKALRRGLRELPSASAFPGSQAQGSARAIGAGFAGEGVKELGGPEWLQTTAELTAYIGPDITKKLLSTGSNKELIDAAKRLGMSDAEITPLIQSESKQKWLSKLSPKRGSTKKALETTQKALSRTYSNIQNSPSAKKEISEKTNGKLINTIYEKLNLMPRKVRGKIEKDLKDLLENPITGESLINFYTDANHNLGKKTKQLSLLKTPIKNALKEISPEVAEDFEQINKMYSAYYPIASKLKPNLASDIVSAAESLGLLGSVVTGNTFTLGAIITEKAAKKLAQQMLINPNLQQLSKKMVVAMNGNKYQLAKKVTQDFIKEVRKFDPISADKLSQISDEELEKFFSQANQAE